MKEDIYRLCSCGSGAKFKFCCYAQFKELSLAPASTLLKRTAEYDLHESWVNENWQSEGLATVGISRRLPNGNFLFGNYVVDIYCLGLKSASYESNISIERMEEIKAELPLNLISIPYEDARSLILGAIEYAEKLGFKPHFEWNKLKHFVESELSYEKRFEFGKDGKPFYVPAPHDDPRKVLKQMERWSL